MLDITQQGSHDSIWVDYSEGVSFCIRPAQNLDFQRRFSALQRPHKKAFDNRTIDPAIALNLMITALSETVLVDWKGVGTKDSELPYTPESGVTLLRNHPAIREFIQDQSLDIANFKVEQADKLGKS